MSDLHLIGTEQDDTLVGAEGNDWLEGLAGNDTLIGNEGNDTLDGGLGQDMMFGGAGDDFYIVDDGADWIVENADEGVDTVLSFASFYQLADHIENLTLAGAAASGTGNDSANIITGNEGDNFIAGRGGDDTLIGGEGNDYVVDFGDGNDLLNGGSGSDFLIGEGGDDVYLPGFGGQDTVHDSGGDDEVRLPAGVEPDQVERLRFDGSSDLVLRVVGTGEQLTLFNWFLDPLFQIERVVFDGGTVWAPAETGALRWLGTAGPDFLLGTQYDETLEGRGGNDNFSGGIGNDVYVLGDLGFDALFDFGGDDEVRLPAGVEPDQVERLRFDGSSDLVLRVVGTGEQLTLFNWFLDPLFQIERVVFDGGTVWAPAETGALRWLGTAGPDFLLGTQYDETLEGRGGNDNFSGGIGNDVYVLGDLGFDALFDFGGDDEVRLPAGVEPDQVERLRFDGSSDLVLRVVGTGEQLTLFNWFLDPLFQIERVVFDGGTVWAPAETGALRWLGTAGPDFLLGTQYDETLEGRGGNDNFSGGIGNDVYVLGDLGFDALFDFGGDDEVRLPAGVEPDQVERLRFDGSSDLVLRVVGTGEQLTLFNWFLDPLFQIERVVFDGGTVWAPAETGALRWLGTAGPDFLLGTQYDETLEGRGGNDNFSGGIGNDVYVLGDLGFDALFDFGGDDEVRLPAGVEPDQVERLRFDGSSDLVLRVVGTGEQLTLFNWFLDPLFQIERVVFDGGTVWAPAETGALRWLGTAGPDFLLGTQYDETLEGRGGNDNFSGGIGNDVYVLGDLGFDALFDFGGDDEVRLPAGVEPDQVERLRFDGSSDLVLRVVGTGEQLTLFNWFLDPLFQIERVVFDGGTVWAPAETGALRWLGTAGPDFLLGTQYDETLEGRGGNDNVNGGGGDDTLVGGAGDDFLIGSWGDDTLDAGEGWDTYLFDQFSGHDTVSEHEENPGDEDWANIGPNILPQDLVVTREGNDLRIEVSGTTTSIVFSAWFDPAVPSHIENFYFQQDGSVLTDEQIEALMNSAPVLEIPIADQTAQDEVAFSFTVAENTFSDPDSGDVLTYSAAQANGAPLPEWLSFDAATRTFEGTPPPAAAGTVTVRVTATDSGGRAASDDFDLTVLYDGIITGTEGPDSINGTAGDDAIFGLGGDDVLDGQAGNDTLDGGAGNDLLDGRAGSDVLQGGAGNDTYVIDDSLGGPTSLTIHNWLGDGQAYSFNLDTGTFIPTLSDRSPDGQIDYVSVSYRDLSFPFGHWFFLDFSTTQLGINFGPGTYLNAERAAFASPGHPGLDVGGDGRGFNTLTGSFIVAAAEFDYSGSSPALLTLSVDFELTSGFSTVSGSLDYNYAGAGPAVHDAVMENPGEGIDTVLSRVSYTLPANVENLTLTGSAGSSGSGNELDNVIEGNAGNNTLSGEAGNDSLSGGAGSDLLDGGAGSDTLQGGAGYDTYVINDAQPDLVIEDPGAGVDTVSSAVTYALTSNVEVLTLTGSGDINGTGNDLGNLLNGNAGANILAGGAGSDALVGGAGNDVLDGGADLDTLLGGLGDDTYIITEVALFSGTTSLSMLSEPGDYIGQGQTYSFDTSTGAFTSAVFDRNQDGQVDYVRVAYNDVPFDDWFFLDFSTAALGVPFTPGLYVDAERAAFASPGHPGLDVVGNGRGSNQVFGIFTVGAMDIDYSGTDPVLRYLSVTFEQHSESLTAPALFGTLVYNVAPAGATAVDSVIENEGEGTDTVMSAITYALPDNVENLVLTGTGNVDGTGNALDNVLTGNSGTNVLTGGAGNDVLNGGSGSNTLIGGTGDDTYVVAGTGDVVTELASEGTDTVLSSISYTLGATLENLTLTGSANRTGTGNGLDNVITGNSGNNTLNGGAGNDTLDGGTGTDSLVGGTGDDTFVVNSSNDSVNEQSGAGTDTVLSSIGYTLGSNVENLFLAGTSAINGTGNTLNNAIRGNSASNTLNGSSGNDTLDGGAGADTLLGGNGNDALAYDAADLRVDGGSGQDTLQFLGSDEVLDLTGIPSSRYTGIEIIDLIGAGSNTLTLNRADVLDLSSSTNTLRLDGNAGDTVNSTGQGWALNAGGPITIGLNQYHSYSSGAATLLIDTDITRNIS